MRLFSEKEFIKVIKKGGFFNLIDIMYLRLTILLRMSDFKLTNILIKYVSRVLTS
jgi:hypothetical protein